VCAGPGGEGRAGARQEGAAASIQIVQMLVVRQQDRVERTDRIDRHRGTRRFFEADGFFLVEARRVEGRIGEQAKPARLDQGGGAADQGEGDVGRGHGNAPLRHGPEIGGRAL